MSEIEPTIRDFLLRMAPGQQIADDDDLLDSGLLDSVGVLSLIAELDKTFRLTIDTKHLTEANFRSIQAIAQLIRRLVGEGRTA